MSEHGKDLPVIFFYKYHFIRKRINGLMKWLCSNKNDSVRILTNAHKNEVQNCFGEHNHKTNTVYKYKYWTLSFERKLQKKSQWHNLNSINKNNSKTITQ